MHWPLRTGPGGEARVCTVEELGLTEVEPHLLCGDVQGLVLNKCRHCQIDDTSLYALCFSFAVKMLMVKKDNIV